MFRGAQSPKRRLRRWLPQGLKARLFACLCTLLLASPGAHELSAQTGAYEGFGAITPGGSGGSTVYVTNLDDAGPGSLREALKQGNRTIHFKVAGDIVLKDFLYVAGSYVTIDATTAPTPGITLRSAGLVIRGARGAHDVVVRGLRVRDSRIDGIQISYGAYRVVIDHVSVSGSSDGNLDITSGSRDVTVSWSILGGTKKNMLIKDGPSRISLHHNLFIDSSTRNPQVRMDQAGRAALDTTVDMRNNVIWNWGAGYGTLVWFGPRANILSNYYSTARNAIAISAARAYVQGNMTADGRDLKQHGTDSTAFPAPPVDTQDACLAARLVLARAGVRPLDAIDQAYVSHVVPTGCPESGAPAPLIGAHDISRREDA